MSNLPVPCRIPLRLRYASPPLHAAGNSKYHLFKHYFKELCTLYISMSFGANIGERADDEGFVPLYLCQMAISFFLTNTQAYKSLRNRHLAQIQIGTFWLFR